MKKHNKYLFIEYTGYSGTMQDTSDGYLTEGLDGNRRIKLPHKNYTLLGIVDECINAPYAEEFSKEIVDPVFRYNRKRNTKKIDWEYWEKYFEVIKDLL